MNILDVEIQRLVITHDSYVMTLIGEGFGINKERLAFDSAGREHPKDVWYGHIVWGKFNLEILKFHSVLQ